MGEIGGETDPRWLDNSGIDVMAMKDAIDAVLPGLYHTGEIPPDNVQLSIFTSVPSRDIAIRSLHQAADDKRLL